MKQNTENVYRGYAATLEQIARQYGNESEEHKAVRKAAWALSYIFIMGQWKQFEDFVVESETPATRAQLDAISEHLKKMGVDPNSVVED